MATILLLCWRDSGHPQGGGSEHYLEQIGRRLAAAGHRVYYRTAGYPGAARREERDGMVFSRGGGRFTVYPRAWGALLAARARRGPLRDMGTPDVVVDTQNGIPFFAVAVCGAPVVLLSHHCHREQWPVAGWLTGRFGWWLESRVSPRVHRRCQYVTVSAPSRDELVELGVDAARIAVVRNGSDPVPAGVRPGGRTTRTAAPSLVTLARLVPHKQIEDAHATLAALRPALPGLTLDVIGDGWWEERLRARAVQLGVADAVVFHGHVDEERKHELLARAWVHLMPSRKEGWGLAVVEAARHGVPTIGYRAATGLADSIVDGETGLLVDGVAAMTAAARRLLRDDAERERLGEAARVRAAGFTWEATAAGFTRVLAAAMRGERLAGTLEG